MFARKVSGKVIITRDKTEESERDTITTMLASLSDQPGSPLPTLPCNQTAQSGLILMNVFQ